MVSHKPCRLNKGKSEEELLLGFIGADSLNTPVECPRRTGMWEVAEQNYLFISICIQPSPQTGSGLIPIIITVKQIIAKW